MTDQLVHYAKRVKNGEIKPRYVWEDPRERTLSKMSQTINVGPGTYTIIFAPSGTGKTALADCQFIVKDLIAHVLFGEEMPESIYHTLERPVRFKMAKWSSLILKYVYNYHLSYESILGLSQSARGLTDKDLDRLDVVKREFGDVLQQNVEFYTSASSVWDNTLRWSYNRGWVIEGREDGVYINGVRKGGYPYVTDKGLIVLKGDMKFFPKENRLRQHFTDTVMQISEEKNQIDQHVQRMKRLRDDMDFAVFDIYQPNRDHQQTIRQLKQRPFLSQKDVKGTGSAGDTADTILGYLDVVDIMSMQNQLDEPQFYEDWDIDLLKHNGQSRHRVLFYIKNSYGEKGFVHHHYFDGATGWVRELPATPTADIYDAIRMGKSPV